VANYISTKGWSASVIMYCLKVAVPGYVDSDDRRFYLAVAGPVTTERMVQTIMLCKSGDKRLSVLDVSRGTLAPCKPKDVENAAQKYSKILADANYDDQTFDIQADCLALAHGKCIPVEMPTSKVKSPGDASLTEAEPADPPAKKTTPKKPPKAGPAKPRGKMASPKKDAPADEDNDQVPQPALSPSHPVDASRTALMGALAKLHCPPNA
jgi:hypothetical protein